MHAMRLWRRALGLASVLAAALLGGCYETEVELIARGDSADIAGSHACRLLVDDGGPFALTVADQAGDAYRFTAPDVAGTLKLKKLAEARWLLQLSDDENAGTFYYAFAEPLPGGGFRALYPKREDKALSAEAMRRYAIVFYDFMGREDVTGSSLKGAPDNLLKFLGDAAVHEMKPWFACEKS